MPPTRFAVTLACGLLVSGAPDDHYDWFGAERHLTPAECIEARALIRAARDAWFDDNSAPSV